MLRPPILHDSRPVTAAKGPGAEKELWAPRAFCTTEAGLDADGVPTLRNPHIAKPDAAQALRQGRRAIRFAMDQPHLLRDPDQRRQAPQQFAVVGNSPDPARVDPTTGLIKYELAQIERYSADTGQTWDTQTYLPHIRTRAASTVVGTVLMQLVDERALKIEIFPGKRAAEISGFDSGALMYER